MAEAKKPKLPELPKVPGKQKNMERPQHLAARKKNSTGKKAGK